MLNIQEGEFIYINKPYGMSSFGALAHIRHVISKRLGVKRIKIGHAGTLDPLATGVLVLCTGKKTKLIEQLQRHTKEYVATLQFGASTASFDREHTVDHTYPKHHITEAKVYDATRKFLGDILQVPPTYSACNVNGKRAYELSRQGRTVELQPKPIHIEKIDIVDFDNDRKRVTLRIICGKGTYIRSLARDIGMSLGSGAYLTDLCRTRVGNVRIEEAMTFDAFHEWFNKVDVSL